MNTADNIVILGVKRTVVAFDKRSGERLWSQQLVGGMTADFVTVVADTARVYAHTGGEMFCLDLFSGAILWRDGLRGLGYGLASIALPGSPAPATPLIAKIQLDQANSNAAATNSSAPTS